MVFYHSITEFVFLMSILGKRGDLPFSCNSDCKNKKSTVSFTHEQNIICSQSELLANSQPNVGHQLADS